jgi:O-glycosyl hydrolase
MSFASSPALRRRSGRARGARMFVAGSVAVAALEILEPRQLLAATVDVAIDTRQHFQSIDGFGTALAWWVKDPYTTDAWQKMYYQDLGSSMLRVDINIKSLAGPDHDLATPVVLGDDLQANIAQFDFGADGVANYGAVAKASKDDKLDDFKLIASLWTPPHWMKGEEVDANSGKPNGTQPVLVGSNSEGGSLIDTPENLQQFGRYVAAYVKGFEQTFGVPFYAISIQNELAFHESYNSAVYSPQLYVKALKAVANAFHQYGITTKIEGPEDVGVGVPSNPWILARQFSYIDAIRNDPEAMADLDIYSIHGYESPEMWQQYMDGRPGSKYPAPNWNGIASDGKASWMTETSGQKPTWTGALHIASAVQDALTQGNVSAWDYWQTADGNGTTSTATLTQGTDTSSQKYVVAKHFFRYIRPGAVRVAATPSDPNGVYVSAFVHNQQQTLTTVLVNVSSDEQTVNLSAIGTHISKFSVARLSSADKSWDDIGPVEFVHGKATVTLPPNSVMTLEGTAKEDIIRPRAESSAFPYQTSQTLRVQFSEDVAGSLDASDLSVQDLSDPQQVVTVSRVGWDSDTNTATFTFSPATLPDGNYRATLNADGITDTALNLLIPREPIDFFVLAADANHDRAVDTLDFNGLASNFGKEGATFDQGDFNYDGRVDSLDFNNFGKTFGTYLEAAPPPPPLGSEPPLAPQVTPAGMAASMFPPTRLVSAFSTQLIAALFRTGWSLEMLW